MVKSFLYLDVDRKTKNILVRQLDGFKVTPKKRFIILRAAGRKVRSFSARRARAQQGLDGTPFAQRSAKQVRYSRQEDGSWKQKKKMFANLSKVKNMSVKRYGDGVAVGWDKRGKKFPYGVVAFKHHHGYTETKSNIKPKDESKRPTVKMAKALLKEGYKKPVMGKGRIVTLKRVSVQYITQNMTFNQVGRLIRFMREGGPWPKRKKKTWTIITPARPFLGINAAEGDELLRFVKEELVKRLYQ